MKSISCVFLTNVWLGSRLPDVVSNNFTSNVAYCVSWKRAALFALRAFFLRAATGSSTSAPWFLGLPIRELPID